MIYKWKYNTPEGLDNMIMNSDGEYLTGLCFENSKDVQKHIIDCEEKDLPVFRETCKWLDIYFSGKEPDFMPKFKTEQITPFRREVQDIMLKIPYGKTVTYNDISKIIAKSRGIKRMSSQAIGGAVGWNPICIIIPCHRVVGSNGNITGYGGGIKNKVALLTHEQNDMSKYFVPKKNSIMNRCKWCNLNNPLYVEYHDSEWGVPKFDDNYLFEMLILESFQAGLSWECILNKRESFRIAYDNFDIDKIVNYDKNKIDELLSNKKIIRNKLKINASINNAKIFKSIKNEYNSFYNYLITFTNNKIIHEVGKITNHLSDSISKDLIKRGMKFVGSTIIYSYLQATGFIYSHDKVCFMYKNN